MQCQVDGGEMRGVLVAGRETAVYFVVFVLSYSRLIYVAVSDKPVNTESFIRMHDQAFRYFGGCPEECVYDQSKLVVLSERFREIEVNERFLPMPRRRAFGSGRVKATTRRARARWKPG